MTTVFCSSHRFPKLTTSPVSERRGIEAASASCVRVGVVPTLNGWWASAYSGGHTGISAGMDSIKERGVEISRDCAGSSSWGREMGGGGEDSDQYESKSVSMNSENGSIVRGVKTSGQCSYSSLVASDSMNEAKYTLGYEGFALIIGDKSALEGIGEEMESIVRDGTRFPDILVTSR